MPDLTFQVEGAAPLPYAAAPHLAFSLRITAEESSRTIPAIALRCQIRIDPTRRRYAPGEQERLLDLFGPPARWGQTLRSMLWTHTSLIVPPFTGSTIVELPVPCSYDFNIGVNKYFYSLDSGVIPLLLLFSGTIFYSDENEALQITQIPWEKETNYGLPVAVWKEMMELYYPNSAWLCLQKDVFDRLYQYKSRLGLPTWERAVEELLAAAEEPVKS